MRRKALSLSRPTGSETRQAGVPDVRRGSYLFNLRLPLAYSESSHTTHLPSCTTYLVMRSMVFCPWSSKGMRLDPNYPPWLAFHLADSYFLLRRYDEAIAALHDSLRRNPNFLPARRVLAIVYAELGREKQARAEAAEILRISPGASLDLWRERLPYKNQADQDRFITGLRKAGLK
jgi:tetratricopeptide (TPR) repeat protein